MKKAIGIIIIFFLSFIQEGPAYSQSFSSGLILGINGAQITGDNMRGFDKGGLLAGTFVEYPFYENLKVRMELVFTEKGSRRPINVEDNHPGIWNLMRLRYIEVPFLASYSYKPTIFIESGLACALLVDQLYIDRFGGVDREKDFADKVEMSFLIGGTYHYSDKIDLFLRYQSSLYNMSTGRSSPVWRIWGERHIGYINVIASAGIRFNFNPK